MASKIPLLLYLLLSFVFLSCKPADGPDFQEGDILFQDGDCGDFCDAIRAVTAGYQGREFSHNGIVLKEAGKLYVLEAISKGVSKTPLDSFLNRHSDENGNPNVLVGRLKPTYRHLIPAALAEAKNQLGKPYDAVFDLFNEAYYCSELIHLPLQKANLGNPVFEIRPMTFKDPETGEFFPVWIAYFEKLGTEIPEGKPGLNPGGMSLDPAIDIIYDYQQ